jgi:hypothetical protein
VLPLFLLIVLVAGAPDEAVGRVTKVIDGIPLMYSSKTARSMRTLSESGLQILIARKPEALRPAKLERTHQNMQRHLLRPR